MLATIPGLGFASVAGIIAHVGPIARYRHGRQLIKLAGTNPTRSETGERQGGRQAMSHRGRSGLRQVVYMATISCLAHNVRLRAHYDRLVSRPERPLAKMTALGACMNKLLLWAFAVMKQRRAFELDHAVEGVRRLSCSGAPAIKDRREGHVVRCPGRSRSRARPKPVVLPPGDPRSPGHRSSAWSTMGLAARRAARIFNSIGHTTATGARREHG